MACEFCAYTTGKWSKLKKHHIKVHVALSKDNIVSDLLKNNFREETLISSCKYPPDYRSTSSNCGNFEVKCSILKEKENVSLTNEKIAELYPNMFKTCKKLQINHENKTTGPQKLQTLTGQKCECALENCTTCQLYHNDKQRGSDPPTEISVCDLCQKSFKSISHLASHKIVHTPLKCYICFHCDKSFNIGDEYDLHLATHFRYKPFKCEICEKCYADKQYLKAHIRLHNGESIHKCEKCNYTSPYLCRLKQHQKIHLNLQSVDGVENVQTCDICQKSFVSIAHLLSHQLMHTPLQLYICSHCDRGFNLPDEYDLHLVKRHFRYRPFRCSLCEKSFSTNSKLKVHTSIHTRDLLNKCSNCEYTTNDRGSSLEHRRVHTNSKPFTCNSCDYSAASRGTLQKHLRTHSGEKSFCCNLCDKRFSQHVTLN
ncbi:zinc finger protein 234-like [Physella acuta]|uniref:zinc finger protein 234-like n=1 Tax=Physella acuta TaxID=109671 RepID=UPI0027DBF704|nr:zinc finger protein 234-like [Physella acuta]